MENFDALIFSKGDDFHCQYPHGMLSPQASTPWSWPAELESNSAPNVSTPSATSNVIPSLASFPPQTT